MVAIHCRCVKGSCVALLVEVGRERDLSGHKSCILKGCRSGGEDCRDARLAEWKGNENWALTPNIGQLWMMHMLSLKKVWYWPLQHLLDSSETSCLVYNRVVDILTACGEVFLPSTADTEDSKEGVSSMCTGQLLFFYPIFCSCTAPAAGRIPA